MIIPILSLVSLLLAGLRICGVKSQSFQAFAHLFVGGVFTAAFLEGNWLLWLMGGLLSAVELGTFIVQKVKSHNERIP